MNEQLTTTEQRPALLQSLKEIEEVSVKLAASGLMGQGTKPEAVFGLMLLCKCEGIDPIAAMKRYHIIEGRPSMRADAMQAEFLASGGGIVFHIRTDDLCSATFFAKREAIDETSRARAAKRFELLWSLECEAEPAKRSKLMIEISKLSAEGEECVLRTFADCQAKGITEGKSGTKNNWRTSPRQMLTARVLTEGIRLINPGLIAGVYTPEEVQEVIQSEALPERASAPPANEISAMRAYQAEVRRQAMEQPPGARRMELLNQVADMEEKIEAEEERLEKLKPATTKPARQNPEASPTADAARSAAFATDAGAGAESDTIPMNHPADAPIVDATDAEVQTPEKKENRAPSEPPDWRTYRLSVMETGRGKLLTEFSKQELEFLYKKRGLPMLHCLDYTKRIEAEMIVAAFKSFK